MRSTRNSGAIPAPISRTALDSLHAKLSAVDGGWLDGIRNGDDVSDNHRDGRGGAHNTNIIAPPIDDYCKILRRIQSGIDGQAKNRRQTPLVNAGYAARMAVMTFVVERWFGHILAKHYASGQHTRSDDSNGCINVVMLGCGMDALGLWSKHYVLRDSLHQSPANESHGNDGGKDTDTEDIPQNSPKVKIYEFDTWDNCILKRQALVNSGLLQESFSFESASCNESKHDTADRGGNGNNDDLKPASDKTFCTISKGRLMIEDSGSEKYQNEDDYFLVALDLRETHPSSSGDDGHGSKHKSIVSQAMHSIGLDSYQPTIVLSELVLAYLGYDGANATMHSIAKDIICGNQNSMFACLEPVFHSKSIDHSNRRKDDDAHTAILSVNDSYSRDYSQQFLGKLKRGNSKYASNTDDSAHSSLSWLHPLGSNSRDILMRVERCGFSSSDIHYATLGVAAANVARSRRIYGAPSFLSANEPFDEHAALALNLNCYGVVCAFSSNHSTGEMDEQYKGWRDNICPWRSENDRDASSIRLNPITSSQEDKKVRALFEKIYVHLYDEYPAIRKMVKSALKMDLCTKDSHAANYSAIQRRFKDKGGNFWVVKDIENSTIIGCVGLGRRKNRRTDDETESMPSTVVVEYEIQRLAVNDQYRGNGMGKTLLTVAEECTIKQEREMMEANTSSVTIKLWAVTPECLIAANKLYKSFEYRREESFRAGSLCMNVYCKLLHIS